MRNYELDLPFVIMEPAPYPMFKTLLIDYQ